MIVRSILGMMNEEGEWYLPFISIDWEIRCDDWSKSRPVILRHPLFMHEYPNAFPLLTMWKFVE